MGIMPYSQLNLVTLVMNSNEVYSQNRWEWNKHKQLPQLIRTPSDDMKVGCLLINNLQYERISQISITITNCITKQCHDGLMGWWYNFTLTQSSRVTCLWGNRAGRMGLTCKFRINVCKM